MRLAWLGVGGVFAVIALTGNGCSTPSASPEESARTGVASQAIQGGTVDSTSTFAVGVCAQGGSLNSMCLGSTCSGALILPNVVATARHCVDQSPQKVDCSLNPTFGGRRSQIRVTTNTTMGANPSGWYAVSSVEVPDDDHICGNDIALLVLSQAIPSSVAKPIVPGVQYLMWDPDQYSPSFIGIGYGITAPNAGDSGTRRKSKGISVLCIPGSPDMPCPAAVNAKEFVGGDGTCSGDSGSSAYEMDSLAKGAPVSFGVLSRGDESDDGTMCVGSVYTRFDAHRDFVLEVAKAASNNWTLYPEPSWTAYKPPATPKPKDAGAPPADSGTKPSGLGLGEACERNKDCASKLCADVGDGTLACSQACDEASDSSCPEGFECRESLCLAADPPPAPPPAATTTTTTGCAATPGSSALSWSSAIFGAAAVLGAVRRRRR